MQQLSVGHAELVDLADSKRREYASVMSPQSQVALTMRCAGNRKLCISRRYTDPHRSFPRPALPVDGAEDTEDAESSIHTPPST